MSYHKCSNLWEKLNSDLNAKVNAGLEASVNGIWTVCVKNGAREATVTARRQVQTADGCLQSTLQMLWKRLRRKDTEPPQEKN